MPVLEFKPKRPARGGPSTEPFTPREVEVLELGHLRIGDVAEELDIAYETVRCHRNNIMRKVGAETWVQAVLIWARQERKAA